MTRAKRPRKRKPEEFFWDHVQKGDGCWEWQAGRNTNGYGEFGRYGLAHRYSWQLANGESPGKRWVLHRCDNKRCVRPDHLFIGDRRANVDDMLQKRRQAVGRRNGASKLTEEQVREIRALREQGLSLRQIAKRFGVNDMNVHYICKRITWAHVA